MSEWITWNGGECPVPEGTKVDVNLVDGDKYTYSPAGAFNWFGLKRRVIAYRLRETTDQRVDRLERELAEMRAERYKMVRAEIHPPEPVKWEPESGNYRIWADGDILPYKSVYDYRINGAERPTRELAEKARDAMRVHNRALAYVHEHAPDWDGSEPWSIYKYSDDEYRSFRDTMPEIGTVLGPQWVMQKLAGDLNSGRVEL